MAITRTHQWPEGTTTELETMGCRYTTTNPLGLDVNSLDFTLTFASGLVFQAIVNGIFQTGWAGSINSLQSGQEVVVTIRTWPELPNGELAYFTTYIRDNIA